MSPFLLQLLCEYGLHKSLLFAVLMDRRDRNDQSGISKAKSEFVWGNAAE
jgi:hypothetical protein